MAAKRRGVVGLCLAAAVAAVLAIYGQTPQQRPPIPSPVPEWDPREAANGKYQQDGVLVEYRCEGGDTPDRMMWFRYEFRRMVHLESGDVVKHPNPLNRTPTGRRCDEDPPPPFDNGQQTDTAPAGAELLVRHAYYRCGDEFYIEVEDTWYVVRSGSGVNEVREFYFIRKEKETTQRCVDAEGKPVAPQPRSVGLGSTPVRPESTTVVRSVVGLVYDDTSGVTSTGIPLIDLVDQPGYLISASPTARTDRRFQWMIIVFLRLRVPFVHAPLQPEPFLPRSRGGRLFASLAPSNAGARLPAFEASNGESATSGVKAYLRSLGTSTGEAFQLHVVNEGPEPVDLSGDGLVVEPLEPQAAATAEREIRQLSPDRSTSATADGYCLELRRDPPEEGMMFRVGGPELQRQFEPMRRILQASRRLEERGALTPDSDPQAYVHSIRQWAIWTREQGFDERGYADALVEHTRKNAVASGQKWAKPLEDRVRALVPGRWRDISQVLKEAGVAGQAR